MSDLKKLLEVFRGIEGFEKHADDPSIDEDVSNIGQSIPHFTKLNLATFAAAYVILEAHLYPLSSEYEEDVEYAKNQGLALDTTYAIIPELSEMNGIDQITKTLWEILSSDRTERTADTKKKVYNRALVPLQMAVYRYIRIIAHRRTIVLVRYTGEDRYNEFKRDSKYVMSKSASKVDLNSKKAVDMYLNRSEDA